MQKVDPENIKKLQQLALTTGMIKLVTQQKLSGIKLAYHPYVCPIEKYHHLSKMVKVWQKLIFNISNDEKFIEEVFKETESRDRYIRELMKMFQLKKGKREKNGFQFTRFDYFISDKNVFKLIEFNTMAVSMTSHSENFYKAKYLSDLKCQDRYIENYPTTDLSESIAQFYSKTNLKGLFVFFVSQTQKNLVQQKIIEVKLLEKGIKCHRINYFQAKQRMRLNGEILEYSGQPISIIYYRTGYELCDICHGCCTTEQCWSLRYMIEKSNAIKVPNVIFELLGMKRMQAEMYKPETLKRYLNEDEETLIKESFVDMWQFDKYKDQDIKSMIEKLTAINPEGYILKPNREGGGHNIYGQKALSTLQNLSQEKRKQYTLMQKIQTPSFQNILINSGKYVNTNCKYEISRYGMTSFIDGKLEENRDSGYLIRAKPEDVDEGGIMAGVGSICSWAKQ